jgi:hypothetical protein
LWRRLGSKKVSQSDITTKQKEREHIKTYAMRFCFLKFCDWKTETDLSVTRKE